jgi:gliding motility-associated-like protein
MNKNEIKTSWFRSKAWSIVFFTIWVINGVIGSTNTKNSGPKIANECLEADYVSQTNVCGNASNGSLIINVKVTDNTMNNNCCQTGLANIECRLFDASNNEVASISFPVSEISGEKTFIGLPKGTFRLELKGFNIIDFKCAEKNYLGFVTILESGNITLTKGNKLDETCTGSMNGLFQIKAQDGLQPYTFMVSSQSDRTASENVFLTYNSLSGGTYNILVQDANGCTASESVTIATLNSSNFTITPTITNVKCFGGNDGAISVEVTGGNSGETYSYTWTGMIQGSSLTQLTAGTYTVTVKPASGCEKTASYVISQPTAITVTPSITNVSCKGKKDGIISLNVSGGNPDYTYAWGPGISATTPSVSMLLGGTYSVTVTDIKSCSVVNNNLMVTEPGDISYDYFNAIDPVESGQNAQIELNGTGITTYLWSIQTPLVNATAVLPLSGQISGNNGMVTKKLTLKDTLAPGYVTFYVQPIFSATCKGDTTEILVKIKPKTSDGLFIPEIYTPNGDGANDDWNIFLPAENEGAVTIYNRSGAKIYEGDAAERWNGNGCPDGPYFYVLSYGLKGADTKKVVKGAVTILRTSE